MPTRPQQHKRERVAKLIMEDHGKSIGQAMIEAGYKPAYAKNPKYITESKSWKELMDKYIPEDLVAQKHNQLLNSKNEQSVKSGIEMAYKLRNRIGGDDDTAKHILIQINNVTNTSSFV